MRLGDTVAAGSHRRKWTSSRRGVGHRRPVACEIRPRVCAQPALTVALCRGLAHSPRSVTGYVEDTIDDVRRANRQQTGARAGPRCIGIDAAHPVECGPLAFQTRCRRCSLRRPDHAWPGTGRCAPAVAIQSCRSFRSLLLIALCRLPKRPAKLLGCQPASRRRSSSSSSSRVQGL